MRVFLDTCVLVSAIATDVLLTLADRTIFQPIWSDAVLTELRDVLGRSGALHPEQIEYRVETMRRAFPRATVTGFEREIERMTCHAKDRHVLAAAVQGNCTVLVTFNTRDFPESSTAQHGIVVRHPDVFLLDCFAKDGRETARAMEQLIGMRRNPPLSYTVLADRLERAGLQGFAAAIKDLDERSRETD